jgi:pseudouridine synthase
MILDGRVTLNGKPVTALPCFVQPATDEIRLDGTLIRQRRPRRVYFLLNKPKGVVCTQRDPEGRPRAIDLIPATPERVYCVGRLDAESTGLIILTNDGELTQRLTHPRYEVAKVYVAQTDGQPTPAALGKLQAGMWLGHKRTEGAGVKVLRRGPKQSLLEIRLTEGRNREIRRLLARLGHKVTALKRTAIGPIDSRGLKVGRFRALTAPEVTKLRRSAGLHT